MIFLFSNTKKVQILEHFHKRGSLQFSNNGYIIQYSLDQCSKIEWKKSKACDYNLFLMPLKYAASLSYNHNLGIRLNFVPQIKILFYFILSLNNVKENNVVLLSINHQLNWTCGQLKADAASTANVRRKHCYLSKFSRLKLEIFKFYGQSLNLIFKTNVYFNQLKNIHLPKERLLKNKKNGKFKQA